MDDHKFSPDDFTVAGKLEPVASRIVLKTLYTARYGRPDCPWSVINLSRRVRKWSVACGKRLHRLIRYMHNTKGYTQHCFVGNVLEECHLGVFVDASFAGDLTDSKSTSG